MPEREEKSKNWCKRNMNQASRLRQHMIKSSLFGQTHIGWEGQDVILPSTPFLIMEKWLKMQKSSVFYLIQIQYTWWKYVYLKVVILLDKSAWSYSIRRKCCFKRSITTTVFKWLFLFLFVLIRASACASASLCVCARVCVFFGFCFYTISVVWEGIKPPEKRYHLHWLLYFSIHLCIRVFSDEVTMSCVQHVTYFLNAFNFMVKSFDVIYSLFLIGFVRNSLQQFHWQQCHHGI